MANHQQVKEFHKILFSVLWFSMFYFILQKLSCLQIMQMITLSYVIAKLYLRRKAKNVFGGLL